MKPFVRPYGTECNHTETCIRPHETIHEILGQLGTRQMGPEQIGLRQISSRMNGSRTVGHQNNWVTDEWARGQMDPGQLGSAQMEAGSNQKVAPLEEVNLE